MWAHTTIKSHQLDVFDNNFGINHRIQVYTFTFTISLNSVLNLSCRSIPLHGFFTLTLQKRPISDLKINKIPIQVHILPFQPTSC